MAFPGSASPGAPNHLAATSGPRLTQVLAHPEASPWTPRRLGRAVQPRRSGCRAHRIRTGHLPARTADRWLFPPGTIVPAGARLVLWCDPDQAASTTPTPPLNTGLALNPVSLDVLLLDPAGQTLDALAAGFQVAGLPLGRQDNGWRLLSAPTPGVANAAPAPLAPPSALRINEWMAAPETGPDWFELHNPADQPVALAGLFLADSPSIPGRTNTRIAPLSFIAPRGGVGTRTATRARAATTPGSASTPPGRASNSTTPTCN